MKETWPKVSIVLPTYNGTKYIRQSIDSCLNQTYKNIELIIVDDGSTDGTPEIIKSYKDERIKYLRHEKNKGLPHALNTGFARAIGEYLTWTSDDNYYTKEAIEKMVFFLRDKNCSFVYCDFYRIKDNNSSNRNIVKLPDFIGLEKDNHIGPCFLYSKKVKETVGRYDPDAELAEDYDYWIRVSKKFSMHHFNEPLYFYRQHRESLNISKYYEAQVVGFLVRIRNDISNADQITDLFINLIAHKRRGFFKLNRLLARSRFTKKINTTLRDFKVGKISFEKSKLDLKNIVDRGLI